MIGFLGAGRVGAQAALEVASEGIDDVTLVDIAPGLAEGEAMDISQKIAETGVDVEVRGSTDYSTLRGSTCSRRTRASSLRSQRRSPNTLRAVSPSR
jgi:malate dehydrogenase